MKSLRFATLFVVSLLLAGCIYEDLDGCGGSVYPNTTIYFSLKDRFENEVFDSEIFNVTLFIYDDKDHLVEEHKISTGELKDLRGKKVGLEPGEYTALAWANTSKQYSEIFFDRESDYHDADKNYIVSAVKSPEGQYRTSDPLFYSPKVRGEPLEFIVIEDEYQEVVAEFRHAHVNINVRIINYRETDSPTESLNVGMTEIASKYCFLLKCNGEKVTYDSPAQLVNSERGEYETNFNIPLFDRTSETMILLKNGVEKIMEPLKLVELIGKKVDLETAHYIPIVIEFIGSSEVKVSVDLPEWEEDEVEPMH